MCGKCSSGSPGPSSHDEVREAIGHLSRKYTQLADLVSEALLNTGSTEAEDSEIARNSRALRELLSRIVGGRPVQPGEFPECCLIGHETRFGSMDWFCTGVLVHPRVVLTAAHCTPRNPNVVALNAEDFAQLTRAEIVPVRPAVIHPRYLQTRPLNDIAVLILRRDATVAPARIATTSEINAASRTTLVGFGNDDLLSTRGFGTKREVTVGIGHIRRSPSDNLDAAEQEFGFESDLEFLAGGGGYDSCNGDSGGPAYILAGGERVVAGLTSRPFREFNTPCGEGGVYTRVDVHRQFIRDAMSAAGIPPL